MRAFKKVLKKVFCLSAIPIVLLDLPTFALVVYVLSVGEETTSLALTAYGLSAYALAISVVGIVRAIRAAPGLGELPPVRAMAAHPLGRRVLEDVAYRAKLSLHLSLWVDLANVVVRSAVGICYRSVWSLALAVYYALLSLLRFSLVRYVRRRAVGEDQEAELRRQRLCGVLLLLMDQALAAIVALMVYQSNGRVYPGVLIYVMAAYTFYIVVLAAVDLVRYRRYGSPVLSAVKSVSLTAALVSLLSLETAMLARFGSEDALAFRRSMVASTGAGVCAVVLALAVYMIVSAVRQIKNMKN